jgi:NAD(P)-dependent dehydrogenase (short-subunit alcohol dehydrogenase family)
VRYILLRGVRRRLRLAGRLEGKTALVSGAAGGLGAALGRLFAREAAHVLLGDRLVVEGEAVASEIRAAGGNAAFVELDVTSADDWRRAVSAAEGLHVLVNNAGIYRAAGVEETSLEEWNEVIGVNQTGTLLGMQAAVPALRRSGGGSIVNISSVVTFAAGQVGAAGYHASKGAVATLSKSAAIEFGKDGIRVNSVHPGSFETPMAAGARGDDPEALRAMERRHPLGRLGAPDEIANAVLFLASDESSFVTGSALVVDGGYSAW